MTSRPSHAPLGDALNLPNRLTLGRLGLCALFVVVLSCGGFQFSRTIALGLFLVASLTDWLDGWIARRWNLITDLGKLLDPLADKILISAAFVGLIGDPYGAPMWMVVVIIAREFLITGLRIVAANRGYILAAERAGKHKTISQIVFVIAALWLDSAFELGIEPGFVLKALAVLHPWLMWIALIITVVSGAIYFSKNKGLFIHSDEAPAVPSRPAFKEWEAVVAALGRGEQALIVRKGGIAEGKSGFQVKHPRFWLLPTRFHEAAAKLKAADASVPEVAPGSEARTEVRIEFFAEVVQVAWLADWDHVAKLDPFHGWKPETLRERFDYKEPGLHAFVVRVHRLKEPVVLPWEKAFDGCKSWVELPLDWEGRPAAPVLDDAAFLALRERLSAVLA